MGNQSSNSRNLGNVDIELAENLECRDFIQQEDNSKLVKSFRNSCKKCVYISIGLTAVIILILFAFFAGTVVKPCHECNDHNKFANQTKDVKQSHEGNDHSQMDNQTKDVKQSHEGNDHSKMDNQTKDVKLSHEGYDHSKMDNLTHDVKQSHEGNNHSKKVNQISTMCLEEKQVRLGEHLGNNKFLDCINYNKKITVTQCAVLCRKGAHIYKCKSHGTNETMVPVKNIRPCHKFDPIIHIPIENDTSCICVPLAYMKLNIFDAGD